MSATKDDVMELHQTIRVLEQKQNKMKKIAVDRLNEVEEVGEMIQLLKKEYETLKEKAID